ncbi:MAG TPA: GNAT family N-acetyltransferase [Rickettsia endosymbiont of Pyrocoelia pectoralis]|nr:GNAT family N-acetyltransferase [Rickettsia endosymbiont of Pyrocoelia pectoralis]
MNRILINLPEVIETSKLKLQMPKAGYGENLYQAMMDGYEDYVKWLNWSSTPPTLKSIEEECRKHHAEFILRDCIRYLIIDKTTNNIVGRCAFPPFQADWSVPQFGISYFIRKSERSNGYATTAAHIMALLAFRILNAKKVAIHCDAENLASIQIPLKLGFKLEYTQKGGWLRQDNTLAELKTFSIFSEDDLPRLKIDFSL